MNRKIVAIALVLMMTITSFVFVVPTDDSDAADMEKCTSHYKPDQYYYRNDTASFTYNGDYVPYSDDYKWADITEFEKKDAEFYASLHGGSPYKNSELIKDHSYAIYWGPTTYSPSNCDKIFVVEGNMDLIYLNSGSYDLKIIDIKFTEGTHDVSFVEPYSIDRNNTIVYRVMKGNDYTFTSNGFNSFAFASSSEFYIEYEISQKSVAYELKDEPVTDTSVNNIYAWYKCDVTMSGQYSIDSDMLIFHKGSNDESRFVSEVVSSNKYYSLSDDLTNKYNSLKSGYYNGGEYSVYSLYKSVNRTVSDGLTIVYETSKGTQSLLLERQTENKINLFSNAYSTIKIAIGDYDTEKYTLFLVYSGSFIPLKPNMSYPIENNTAKTYTLVVYNNNGDTADLFTSIPIYTEGVPEVDNNSDLLAGICIGLCVLVFLVVLIAGNKPRWSKKKYDMRPVKKSKSSKKDDAQEQEQASADMSQQPPAQDVPKEEPLGEASETEEEPKKKGLFGRRSKEE